jgi:choline-sulfatase
MVVVRLDHMHAPLRLACAAVATLAVLALGATLARRPADSRHSPIRGPVIVVSIDTLRADHVSAYGSRRAHTPALDTLAADGVLFERAYSHAPQTLPSHASVLTGLLPCHHGVRDNVGFALAAGVPTLPERLRTAGLRSAAFVSAYVLRSQTGIARGFDEYDAPVAETPDTSMGSLRRDGAETVAAAARWLDRQPDDQFLLFVHLYEPHRPWHVPQAYATPGGYAGAVGYADALVGRLVSGLRTRGLYERSLIVVFADHGEGLGDHGEEEHGIFLYDEAVHVPLIVKLPGLRRAGARVSELVGHVDVMPSILDLVGAAPVAGLDGLSLRPLLEGKRAPWPERSVYAEGLYARHHFGWSELLSLTDERFRFILAPRPELYDLHADPGERRNLAAERAGTAAAMTGVLRSATSRNADTPASVSPEERERLQALGYVGTSAGTAGNDGALPDPKDEVEWLERYRTGVRLVSERRFDEASAAFREVLARHPEMVDVWSELGHTELRAGRAGAGVEALARAVALAPGATATVLAAAGAELRVGAVDRAAGYARMVLTRDPAGAHEILARVALARGRLGEARAEAQLAERAQPGLPLPAFIEGILLHKQGQYERAVPLLEQAAAGLASRRLSLRDLNATLGDALAHLGRSVEAEQAFAREIALFPENGVARASLALLYAAEDRRADADRALADLVETTPTPDSFALAARTYEALGDRRSARATVGRGLLKFPTSAILKRLVNGH